MRSMTNLRGALLMLRSVVQVNPERIQPYYTAVMKLLGNKAKDHLQGTPANTGFEGVVRQLIVILEICQVSIAYLGDQRKHFIAAFGTLIDKSKSGSLMKFALDTVRQWAFNTRDTIPSMKDKAALLVRMAAFEHRLGERFETLFQSYLELIYELYTEPTLRRSDLTTRLEPAFLLGCRALDPSLRERFIDLLDASIPRSLYARLCYIWQDTSPKLSIIDYARSMPVHGLPEGHHLDVRVRE